MYITIYSYFEFNAWNYSYKNKFCTVTAFSSSVGITTHGMFLKVHMDHQYGICRFFWSLGNSTKDPSLYKLKYISITMLRKKRDLMCINSKYLNSLTKLLPLTLTVLDCVIVSEYSRVPRKTSSHRNSRKIRLLVILSPRIVYSLDLDKFKFL